MDSGSNTFRNLGIAPAILAALDRLAYTAPTPIQRQAIGPGIEGKDIIGIAQTGTGKTLAFGIPVIQRVLSSGERVLVLVPTRELALQVEETIQKITGPLRVRTAVLIGGAPMGRQVAAVKGGAAIIIATPGRLLDHMEAGFNLGTMRMLVLDEADRMLDMGFLPAIKRILAALPTKRQTMLFSATLSKEILAIATATMSLPLRIEVAPQGTTAEGVEQELYLVSQGDKLRLLEKLLAEHRGSTLVFTRTKHGAAKLARKIADMGHSAIDIHSNRSLNQRKAALGGFKAGQYRVLVATDIMARGIDVKEIELVINFDLPGQSEDYVHRIGRTARAGAEGRAISFVLPTERGRIRAIERLIQKPINFSPLPALPPPKGMTYTDQARRESLERPQRSRTYHAGPPRRSGGRPPRRFGPPRGRR